MAREDEPRELELRLMVGPGAAWPGEDAARARWRGAAAQERERARREARRLERLGARVLRRGAAGYPAALEALADPPAALYVRGAPLSEPGRTVAVVGTRAATPYGLERAMGLARGLARAGIAVMSGLARGVDAAAHRGALDAAGVTAAVLPGGVDTVVPSGHRALAARIAERGSLLSEYALGPPFGPAAFVRRNRLIAAMSAATVVVEAGEPSGALATAAAASRLGRPVLAVPADVDRPQSRGCLALLRSGARVCAEVADVLSALGAAAADLGEAPAAPGGHPGGERERVQGALATSPRTLDDIARRSGLASARVLALLLELELGGLAEPRPGGRFVRSGTAS